MANSWFRLYAEFMHDPKVQMLSEQDQRRLIMLFCARCNGNVTLHDEEVTFLLRISNEEWQKTKKLFVEKGFINEANNVLNWDKRQFASDSSAARVARHRAKVKSNVTERNVTVTPQNRTDTDTDTDTEKNLNTLVPSHAGDQCPQAEILKLYAEHLPMLTQIRVWNEQRQKLLRSRWREDPSRQNLEWWGKFFRYVARSDFLTGRAGEWQADLEWLLTARNFVKVIEGKYENKDAA